jgi:hypothetical protein
MSPMLASQRSDLEALVALAGLLETIERSGASIAAEQYQLLIGRLKTTLAADLPANALQAVLGAYPSLAELYENLQYEHAGLCRSPLEAGVQAEQQARELFERLARPAPR